MGDVNESKEVSNEKRRLEDNRSDRRDKYEDDRDLRGRPDNSSGKGSREDESYRRRYDSRERDRRRNSRERDRRRDRDVYRRHSRSRSDSRQRRRRRKSRSRSKSPPPRKIESKVAPPPPNRFWDGFQWVERLRNTPYQFPQNANILNGSTDHVLPPALAVGNQKDRRVYVGNLPATITADAIKDFSKLSLKF